MSFGLRGTSGLIRTICSPRRLENAVRTSLDSGEDLLLLWMVFGRDSFNDFFMSRVMV